jgi:hypothetical protein
MSAVDQAEAPTRRWGRRRFTIGLGASAALSVVSGVAVALLGVSAFLAWLYPDPAKTHRAGTLQAPNFLGGHQLKGSAADVNQERQARDGMSRTLGGRPAIAAAYDGGEPTGVTLAAGQGYTDPIAYLKGHSSGTADVTTFGPDKCVSPSRQESLCIRTDRGQRLTVVVVAGLADGVVANLTDEAWRDLGGG